MKSIMEKIPNKDTIKNLSAIRSSSSFFLRSGVRIEKKENTVEIVSNSAIIAVNSSISPLLDLSPMCNEVIINRQNPNRFADVLNMCCDVLFAKVISIGLSYFYDAILASAINVFISFYKQKSDHKSMKKTATFGLQFVFIRLY
jgi:hypothetical protein